MLLLVPLLLVLAGVARLPEADDARSTDYRVEAGRILIFNLPEQVGDQRVAAYTPVEPPALSGFHQRSFFWRTRTGDTGEHTLRFKRRFEAIPADTVAIRVSVE
ncbi:MAG: hypothetical protein RhofKO_38290 [Rhodothermales bacterium]